jgi:hypothetical protein
MPNLNFTLHTPHSTLHILTNFPPLMIVACPHLPHAPDKMDWRELRRHGGDRSAEFYLSALTYGQHLWQRGLAARALLAVDRALLADVPSGDPILAAWPLPYLALRWIMTHASAESLVGNPRVHYQHLAGRIKGHRAAQQRARAWAAWHLACLANSTWPGDPKHQVHEPSVAEIADALNLHGLPNETQIWKCAWSD